MPVFAANIPGPLRIGDKIEIAGKIKENARKMSINLCADECEEPRDVVIHFDVRFHRDNIISLSRKNGVWVGSGNHDTNYNMFVPGTYFRIVFEVKAADVITIYCQGKFHSNFIPKIPICMARYVIAWADIDAVTNFYYSHANAVNSNVSKVTSSDTLPRRGLPKATSNPSPHSAGDSKYRPSPRKQTELLRPSTGTHTPDSRNIYTTIKTPPTCHRRADFNGTYDTLSEKQGTATITTTSESVTTRMPDDDATVYDSSDSLETKYKSHTAAGDETPASKLYSSDSKSSVGLRRKKKFPLNVYSFMTKTRGRNRKF